MATSMVPTAIQSLSIPGRESGVFARVRLVNEHGRNAMQHLGENYDKLSFHNRQYLRVKRVGMSPLRILSVLPLRLMIHPYD